MTNWTKIRRWTWEFPQSLLGLILLPFYKKTLLRKIEYKGQKFYIYDKFPGGISLGYYSLVDYNRTSWNLSIGKMKLKNNIKHESGHGIQSEYFGPLYLPFVGLLSGIHNIIHKIKKKMGMKGDYYRFFIEAWANKLGGVDDKF